MSSMNKEQFQQVNEALINAGYLHADNVEEGEFNDASRAAYSNFLNDNGHRHNSNRALPDSFDTIPATLWGDGGTPEAIPESEVEDDDTEELEETEEVEDEAEEEEMEVEMDEEDEEEDAEEEMEDDEDEDEDEA